MTEWENKELPRLDNGEIAPAIYDEVKQAFDVLKGINGQMMVTDQSLIESVESLKQIIEENNATDKEVSVSNFPKPVEVQEISGTVDIGNLPKPVDVQDVKVINQEQVVFPKDYPDGAALTELQAMKADIAETKQQNAEILERLNGVLDTNVTGSNVEDGIPVKQIGSVAEVHNETLSVTAGSISLSRTIKDIKYRYVFVGILENSNNVHSFSVSQFWYVSKESRAFNDKDMIIKSSTYRGLSSHQDVLGEQYRLQVNNDSDADQEYNIYVYGVM